MINKSNKYDINMQSHIKQLINMSTETFPNMYTDIANKQSFDHLKCSVITLEGIIPRTQCYSEIVLNKDVMFDSLLIEKGMHDRYDIANDKDDIATMQRLKDNDEFPTERSYKEILKLLSYEFNKAVHDVYDTTFNIRNKAYDVEDVFIYDLTFEELYERTHTLTQTIYKSMSTYERLYSMIVIMNHLCDNCCSECICEKNSYLFVDDIFGETSVCVSTDFEDIAQTIDNEMEEYKKYIENIEKDIENELNERMNENNIEEGNERNDDDINDNNDESNDDINYHLKC